MILASNCKLTKDNGGILANGKRKKKSQNLKFVFTASFQAWILSEKNLKLTREENPMFTAFFLTLQGLVGFAACQYSFS